MFTVPMFVIRKISLVDVNHTMSEVWWILGGDVLRSSNAVVNEEKCPRGLPRKS